MLLHRLRPWKPLCALAILLWIPSCFATTVILVVTRSGMLIGADGKTKAVCTDAAARCIDDDTAPNIKVVLVQKRFAVAAIGLQRADITAANGTPLLVYDFKTWMQQIEDRLLVDVTLSELTRTIKAEYTQLLVGLEKAIRNRTITRVDPNLTPLYVVVGYESGIPSAYGIRAEIDWEHQLIRYPMVSHIFPALGGRVDYGLRIIGHKSALNDFCVPRSPVHRRISQRLPGLVQFCSGHDLSLIEARSLIVELLKLQSESDRDGVGPPYNVIIIKAPRTMPPQGNFH